MLVLFLRLKRLTKKEGIHEKTKYKMPIQDRCCNFKLLEQKCFQYNHKK